MSELLKSAIQHILHKDEGSRPDSKASSSSHEHSRRKNSAHKQMHLSDHIKVLSPKLSRKNSIMPTPHGDPGTPQSNGTPTHLKPKEDLPTILKTQRRTLSQAMILYKAIQDNQFIKKFRDENSDLNEIDALLHLCQNLGYEIHEGGSIIFQEGEVANEKMYLVYSGEAVIVRRQADFYTMKNLENQDKPEDDKDGKSTQRSKKQSDQGGDTNRAPDQNVNNVDQASSPRNNAMNGNSDKTNKFKKLNIDTDTHGDEPNAEAVIDLDKLIKSYGTVVDVMKKGRFFGDKALTSNAPRAASVIAGCRSEFLTISATLFKQIKAKFEKTNRFKLNFLMDHFPSMDSVTNQKTVEFLLYIMEERLYQFHNIVINENTKGKDIFIIVKGSCDVFKKKPGLQENPLMPETAAQSLHKTHVFVCSIYSGVFFGQEILFKKDSNYEYTIRASSAQCVLYAIEKSKFLLRFPYMSIEGMKVFNAQQKEHFETLFQKSLAGTEMIQKSLHFKHGKKTILKPIIPLNEYNLNAKTQYGSSSPGKRNELPELPIQHIDPRLGIEFPSSRAKDKIMRGHAGHLAIEKLYHDDLIRSIDSGSRKVTTKDIQKNKFDFGIPEDSPGYRKILVTPQRQKLKSISPESQKLKSNVKLLALSKLSNLDMNSSAIQKSFLKEAEPDISSVRNLKKKIQNININRNSEDVIAITKPIFPSDLSANDTTAKFTLPDLSLQRNSEVDMVEILTDRFSTEQVLTEGSESKLLFIHNSKSINSLGLRGHSRKTSNLRTKWINMQKIRCPNSGIGNYIESLKSTTHVMDSIFITDGNGGNGGSGINGKSNSPKYKGSNLGLGIGTDKFAITKMKSENIL